MMSLIAAMALIGNIAYGYDEGGSDPYTVKFGHEAGYNNGSDGQYNTFLGYQSGYTNTKGDSNLFIGYQSGYSNTTGEHNTFIGKVSGYSNTEGYWSVFIGTASGYSNTSGHNNVFIGIDAGYDNTIGYEDTFIGLRCGESNTIGNENTYIGAFSGQEDQDGMRNTFLGTWSGVSADVNNSVFLGYGAGLSATRSNTLYIANDGTDDPLIYGEFDTKIVKINGDLNTTGPVTASFNGSSDKEALKMFAIDVNNTNTDKKSDVGFSMTNARESFTWSFRTWEPTQGFAIAKYGNGATKEFRLEDTDPTDATTVVLKLANGAYCDGVWHDASSRSYKKDIKPLNSEAAQKAFAKLQPVTYVYKSHPQDTHVGFIAEDVPQLVADPGRKSISTVDIVAVLTKVVQEQEKRLEAKDKEIAEMKRTYDIRLAEQAKKIAKLEKMRARLSRLETILTNLAILKKHEKFKALSLKTLH